LEYIKVGGIFVFFFISKIQKIQKKPKTFVLKSMEAVKNSQNGDEIQDGGFR
jgi:hypothetical protein